MVTVQANLLDMIGGNRKSKIMHIRGTLETARDYLKGRFIIGEMYDPTQKKQVEIIFMVESVELVH